jgi:HK97 family phage portal protein
MSIRQRLKEQKAMTTSYAVPATTPVNYIGNSLSIYPQDTGLKFYEKGYKLNDAIYSIVSTNADKGSQVRLYHAKVKTKERKTRQEWEALQKGAINDKVIKELARMEKAMMDELVVSSPLSELLNKPTRYQTQSEWIEMLILLRELQGEGNLWKSRGMDGGKPIELLTIPKPHLILKGNLSNPWDIAGWQFALNGSTYDWKREDVVMWKYNNPAPLSNTFEHMRGLAPLESAKVLMQGMNEADVSVASANNSRGAAGFAFAKNIPNPTIEQKTDMRRQFNEAINNEEMANKIAILAGEWGYYNIGQTLEELKLLDQYNIGFKRLCRIFRTPSQIFDEGNGTWDNQKQAFRRWIYAKIAPMMYGLRGVLNEALILDLGLDPERDLVNCDIMSLPEMSQDIAEQVTALKDASWLTDNEKRIETGYEPISDPSMDMTARQMEGQIGGGLDAQMNLLNQ